MDNVFDKLDKVYGVIQTLDIAPTRSNMEKLLQCLYGLQDIKKILSKEGAADGEGTEERTQTDHG